ncbi:MAG: MCE family protein [Rhizobium sp.]|nr:MCE family protein [Rhizobium sp.]
METKANYAIVGFFTVVVMLAAFAFVYWMQVYGREGRMEPLRIIIPGSANGLSVGSPVRFNGIPIGSIRRLTLDATNPDNSIVITEVLADAPIYPGTRAVVELQGLTGAAYIELSGGDTSKEKLLVAQAAGGEEAKILAEQSGLTNLVSAASDIMRKTETTVDEITGLVQDNRQPLNNTIRNVETFSGALRDNAPGVDRFLESVSKLSGTIESLSGRLDSTLASVDSLVKSIDPKKIDNILKNTEKISGDLAAASGDMADTVQSFRATADAYREVGTKVSRTLDNVEKLMAEIDPKQVGDTLDDVRAAVSDARSAMTGFKEISDDIAKRRPDIDKTITNISETAEKINKASTRVDGVLAKVDSFLGEGDSQSLFADARATLQSYRELADTLNEKIGPIADNLAKFTGSGLSNVEALVDDTRRTMKSLDNAISRFDSDPQRLIFGGQDVKEFDGRVRR